MGVSLLHHGAVPTTVTCSGRWQVTAVLLVSAVALATAGFGSRFVYCFVPAAEALSFNFRAQNSSILESVIMESKIG